MEQTDVIRLQDPEFLALLRAAAGMSPDAFVLKHSRQREWPLAALAEQLQCRLKFKAKLPSWCNQDALCLAEAYEQASGEVAAALKPSLCPAKTVLDLCGGLGVDALAFARAGCSVFYNDLDPVKVALFQWNAQQFGLPMAAITQLSAEVLLEQCDANSYDLIYADPSRRVDGQRTQDLEAWTPAIRDLLPLLADKAPYLLLKLAPHVTAAQLATDFIGLRKTWLVSVQRECKERLALIDLRQAQEFYHESAVCLHKNNETVYVEAAPACNRSANIVERAQAFIYDPDPAIVLAGVSSGLWKFGEFNVLAQSHGSPDASNALLLCSDQYYPDFPGRVFKVLHQGPLQRKAVRAYLRAQGLKRGHLWRCQSQLSVGALRELIGFQDGAGASCVVIGLQEGDQWFMHVERLHA